jgi:hypothetical protein
MEQNELPLDPHHLGVPTGVPKMIFERIARSAQTVHQYCVKINIISKQTKMSFFFTLVTKEVHRVQPKRFLCPWYIWHKPCSEINSISKRIEASFLLTHVT